MKVNLIGTVRYTDAFMEAIKFAVSSPWRPESPLLIEEVRVMKNKKNLVAILLFVVLIGVAFLIAMALRANRIEPREILAGRYYDFTPEFEFTFQLGDKKYVACDVQTLDDEEYYHFADYPVSYPVYVYFDDTSMTAVISGELSEKRQGYYVFRDENDRMLLIPEEERRGLFEQKRPLAFYLLEID